MEGKISNQHYLYSYLTYLRLKISIERNLLLIENLRQYLPDQQVEEGRKITKPQDLVRLYDIIIQVRNCCLQVKFDLTLKPYFCTLLLLLPPQL